MKDPHIIIVQPHITEKSVALSYGDPRIRDDKELVRKYTFLVSPDANKLEIKAALEAIYNTGKKKKSEDLIEVTSVRTIKVVGKKRRRGQKSVGYTPDRKKAVITLAKGQLLEDYGSKMPTKRMKPTSPGRRFMATPTYSEVTKGKPEKTLLAPKPSSGGRNSYGRVTSVNVGGGHKQKYRIIDFKRNKDGIVAKVAAIEYDPNRTCRIALLHYMDGEKRYIIAPKGLEAGARISSGEGSDILPGNCLMLKNIPLGTLVHNIELQPNKGGQMVRSAGASAQVMAKEGSYVTLRLPSGEMRMVHNTCKATVGEVGNAEHENESIGKAGKNRSLGRKPHVRGVVKSPRDHPHGGGEAKSPVGRKKGPVDRWGNNSIGKKTRHNKRTNQYIVRRRAAK